jgi:hypothetical protein
LFDILRFEPFRVLVVGYAALGTIATTRDLLEQQADVDAARVLWRQHELG